VQVYGKTSFNSSGSISTYQQEVRSQSEHTLRTLTEARGNGLCDFQLLIGGTSPIYAVFELCIISQLSQNL
jgi:hypothetical protein